MSEQWPVMTLGEVIHEMKDGGTPKRSVPENFGGDITWCVVKDIKPEIFDSKEKLTQQGLDGSSAKLWPAGSIIISLGATIGKIGIARVPTATKQGLSGIVVNKELILAEFLVYLLHHKVEEIQGLATGTTIKEVRPRKLMNELKIPVPPLEEQQRIVSILDESFDNISNSVENTTQRLENANSIFQSILLNTFSRADEKLNERKLSTLCITDRGITYGVIKLGEHIDEGVPCLRTSNVKPLKIETAGMKKIALELSNQYSRTILQGGEVLVNVRGTLGGVASVPSEMTGWNVSREVAVVPVDTSIIDSDFLAYWIGSPKSQEWLTGMKKGAAYTGINLGDLRNLPVKFPDIQEQRNIVKNLNNLSNKVVQIQEMCSLELENYSELKQSILQEAFNGKLMGGVTT